MAESGEIFERLVRGQAASREYVDAVKREIAARRTDYQRCDNCGHPAYPEHEGRRCENCEHGTIAPHSPNDVEVEDG